MRSGGLPADGVSIPYDSTSYIAPVSTSKLFNDIRQSVPRVPRRHKRRRRSSLTLRPPPWLCPHTPTGSLRPGCLVLVLCICRLKDDKQQETPFVVKLRSYFSFDTPKPLFRFVHPNRDLAADGSVDNSRYASVRFTAAADGLVHGVAGYFESRLFEELQLSTYTFVGRGPGGLSARGRVRTGTVRTGGSARRHGDVGLAWQGWVRANLS